MNGSSSGPDAETRVPCPCCGKGMVSPTRAAKVKSVLKEDTVPNENGAPTAGKREREK